MKIILLSIGATAMRPAADLIKLYAERIARYVPMELIEIKEPKNLRRRSIDEQKVIEGELILAGLEPSDRATLLDERGRLFSSTELCQHLDKVMQSGVKRWVWIIGGPYGFSPAVYEAVPDRISLSKMTFPHDLVRTFALEQIYRAFTIRNGEPYHHD